MAHGYVESLYLIVLGWEKLSLLTMLSLILRLCYRQLIANKSYRLRQQRLTKNLAIIRSRKDRNYYVTGTDFHYFRFYAI